VSRLTDDIARLTPEQRALLERRLAERRAGRVAPLPSAIRRVDDGEPTPLSLAQKRLWLYDQLEPRSSAFNIHLAFRIEGALDRAALGRAVGEIERRHDALRLNIATSEGEASQVPADSSRPPILRFVDRTDAPRDRRLDELRRVAASDAIAPFDLAADPLVRVALVGFAPDDHGLLITVHHIASDGGALRVILDELRDLYGAFVAGEESPLDEPPVRYADFARWQREWVETGALDAQIAFWRDRLNPPPPVLDLPTDRPRPGTQTHRAARYEFSVPADVASGLEDLARGQGATLFMAMLTAFEVVIGRECSQWDILVGTPVANRNRTEVERLVGFLGNTVLMRTDLSGDPAFREALLRIRSTSLDALAHQEVPYERVIEELPASRHRDRTPLLQVLFNTFDEWESILRFPGASVRQVSIPPGFTRFDLSLSYRATGDGLRCSLVYSADLFDETTAARIAGGLGAVASAAVAAPERRISELPRMSGAETSRILEEWNRTGADFPDATIHGLFADRAKRDPHATALRFDGGALTYDELDGRSNRVARRLVALGAGPEARVAIAIERSVDMVVGVLAILKTGAAYVPLDPTYPVDRLAFMLEDSRPCALVTTQSVADRFREYPGPVVLLDGAHGADETESAEPIATASSPLGPAYVMYTSGSTGKPKGVLGTHRGAINRFAWMWSTYPFEPGEVCCQKTALSFVDSVWELFGGLLAGVPTAIVDDASVVDTRRFVATLARHSVSRVVLVPSLLDALLDSVDEIAERLPDLRLWVVSGEALPPTLAERFHELLPSRTLVNLYGSSEVAADATWCEVTADVGSRVPIGRPIANTSAYVLDDRLRPVPVGARGEIFVGGHGVARGYHDRPALTAERFLPDPFGATPGARMYRTGDLGRFRPDGMIEYLGRADFQVKVRGIRVEPGEVESVLRRYEGVRDTVVVAAEEPAGGTRLVAYAVGAFDPDELRAWLRERLPDALVPSVLVRLDALPHTPNGKIDRSALPPVTGVDATASPFVAPRDDLERQIAEIWGRALAVDSVGALDDFFDLGGHSLLAVRIVAEIERRCGIAVTPNALLEHSTVESLARLIRVDGGPKAGASVVAVQPNGTRPPLVCIHGIGGGVIHYRELARHLGADQPLLAVAPDYDEDGGSVVDVERLAERYVEALRAHQPSGPYYLGGQSFGGTVAFEMARQLRAAGEHVALLALFDTYGPGYPSFPEWPERLANHLRKAVAQPGLRAKTDYLATRVRAAGSIVRHRLWRRARALSPKLARGFPAALHDPVRAARIEAVVVYSPEPYEGRVTLFRSTAQPVGCREDALCGWGQLATEGVEVYHVPGGHGELLDEPYVTTLAAQLAEALDRAQRAASRSGA
jgi:amino acid adenylation domain-containing protein